MPTTRTRTLPALLVFLLALVAGLGFAPRHAEASVIRRYVVHNTAATSNTDIIASDFTCWSGHESSAFRVTIALASTDSVVRVQVNNGGTAVYGRLNGGTALTAGNLYTFSFGASASLTFNIQAETSTTAAYVLIEEVTDDAL